MNEKSITTITLKKINKKSVYQYIYEHRQTAKQQIVQDLTMGLSMHSGTLEHICIDPEGPECYCASFYLRVSAVGILIFNYRISGIENPGTESFTLLSIPGFFLFFISVRF